MRYEVYDLSCDVSWGVFDEYDEAEALAEALSREDYTREITIYGVDENED